MMCTWNPSGLWTVFETSCEFIIFSKSKRFFKKLSSASIKQLKLKKKESYYTHHNQTVDAHR